MIRRNNGTEEIRQGNPLERLKEYYSEFDLSLIHILIRWGGMRRLSGFLPVQSVYADFYVEEKLWPDYEKSDFYRAMDWYKKQDVTYGG